MISLRRKMMLGSAYSFAALIVAKLISVFNLIFVSRVLGSANLGILAIQQSILAVAAVFATFGIPAATVKFIAEERVRNSSNPGAVVSAGLLLTAISATMSCGVVFLLIPYLAGTVYRLDKLVLLLVVGTFTLLCGSIPAPLYATFQGVQRIRDMSLRDILLSAISVPLTLTFVWTLGLFGAVLDDLVIVIVGIIINLVLLRRVWSDLRLSWKLPRQFRMYRKLLGYGSATVLAGLVATPVLLFSYTLLISTHSFQAMGFFSVALALASYLSFISVSVGIPLLPAISELNTSSPERVPLLTAKTIRVVSWIALPLSVTLALFSGPIVFALYGPEFSSAAGPLVLTAAGSYFAAIASVVGYSIAGTGKVWHGVALNALWGLYYFTLSWSLVPARGVSGLAFAYFFSYLLHAGTVLAYSKLVLRLPIRMVSAPILIASVSLLSIVAFADIASGNSGWWIGSGVLVLVIAVEWHSLWPAEQDIVRTVLRRIIKPFGQRRPK